MTRGRVGIHAIAPGVRAMRKAHLEMQHPRPHQISWILRRTRHFAKRQITWFRGDPNVHWLTLDEEESGEHIAHRVLEYLEHQGIPGASRVA